MAKRYGFWVEDAIHDVGAHVPVDEADAGDHEGHVIPGDAEGLLHEAGGDEDADGHGGQKERTQEKQQAGRALEVAEGFKSVMQCVCGPGELPGAEIVLAALFVKIGEDQEDEQCDGPGDEDQTCGDSAHAASLWAACSGLPGVAISGKQTGALLFIVSYPVRINNTFCSSILACGCSLAAGFSDLWLPEAGR